MHTNSHMRVTYYNKDSTRTYILIINIKYVYQVNTEASTINIFFITADLELWLFKILYLIYN